QEIRHLFGGVPRRSGFFFALGCRRTWNGRRADRRHRRQHRVARDILLVERRRRRLKVRRRIGEWRRSAARGVTTSLEWAHARRRRQRRRHRRDFAFI